MNAFWVTVLLFLHIDFSQILPNMLQLSRKETRNYLPKRFIDNDADLEKIEKHAGKCGLRK